MKAMFLWFVVFTVTVVCGTFLLVGPKDRPKMYEVDVYNSHGDMLSRTCSLGGVVTLEIPEEGLTDVIRAVIVPDSTACKFKEK